MFKLITTFIDHFKSVFKEVWAILLIKVLMKNFPTRVGNSPNLDVEVSWRRSAWSPEMLS